MTQAPTSMTRRALAAMIDHTLLKPEATQADIAVLCQQALHLQVYAVCVSPTMVAAAAEHLARSTVKVAAVIGFPSGAHRSDVKADEAARSADDGADEADMVIDLGRALSGDWSGVGAEIAAVRAVLSGRLVLKVIIESAVLTTEQIVVACRTAEAAGADFVKTSTGFHPAGGASVEAVEVMTATVGGRLGVKAAGGIRDAHAALAMVGAGATRLGLSSTAAVLAQLDEPRSS